MADVPFMDEETGAEEARQRALWALHRPSGVQQPLVQDQEVTPQQLADERFAKSPFGWIDSKLKGAEDWIKGRVKKRQEPFQAIVEKDKAAGLGSSHLSWPDPVELAAMMGVGGARTANRWLYGTKDPSQLREEDLLGPPGMSAMAAPFAALKHGASLGSAGGKLAAKTPFKGPEPIRAYHGTTRQWEGEFDPTQARASVHSQPRPYFADDPAEASGYALNRGDTLMKGGTDGAGAPHVMPADIDIKQPFDGSLRGKLDASTYERLVGAPPERPDSSGYDVLQKLFTQEAEKLLPDDVRALGPSSPGYWGRIYDKETAPQVWEGVYKRLEKEGYDGFVEPGTPADYSNGSYTKIVPFKQGTVKSATSGETLFADQVRSGTPAIVAEAARSARDLQTPFTRQVDDLGYYSKLDEVLGSLRPTDTVTMDTLAKRGVKAAEIEARGLSPFIADGKGAKVSDLQGGAQPVQVRESQYGGPAPANWDYLAKAQYGRPYSELSERARLDIRRQSEVDDYKDPKWKDYATDGDNPSYHEGVLHLPLKPYDQLKPGESGAPEFRSGHWAEPNAIAHYRASMQPTEGGGKAYLIDELQSDWGQKLRDGGVRDEAKIADLNERINGLDPYQKGLKIAEIAKANGGHVTGSYDSLDPYKVQDFIKAGGPGSQEVKALYDDMNSADRLRAELRTAEAATPGNPFVNTTEQWMTTALRRMMRNAAEQEADGIAITPGAVHNERFGLSNHVSGLRYNPDTKGLQYKPPGEENSWYSLGGREVAPDKLSDYVGKEMAEKMLAQPREGDYGGWHTLDHLGQVEVGGEGMKYAYDKILPKLLGKELSKLDPSIKYGQRHLAPDFYNGPLDQLPKGTQGNMTTTMPPEFANPFHHFPLTPKAREEIMKGLPLFNAPGGPEAIAEALRAQQQLQTPFTQDE